MRRIIIYSAIALSLLGQSLSAQNQSKQSETEVLQAPEWFADLENVEELNYFDVLKQWNKFLEANPSARVKTPYNKAVLNYFKRWQKRYKPFVNKEGRIILPSQEEDIAYINRINTKVEKFRASSAVTNVSPWKVIAPLQTYDYKTKQPKAAQANVQRLDVSRTNPNILYAGTQTGMVFRTDDKGETWKPVAKDHYFGGEITSLEISKQDPNKVVLCAGAFVWLTTDGGENWQLITPSVNAMNVEEWSQNYKYYKRRYRRVYDAVFSPDDDNIILLANKDGLFKTTNSGANWQLIKEGQCFDIKWRKNNEAIFALIRVNGKMVLHKSTDQGNTFLAKTFTGFNGHLESGRIAISESEVGKQYIYVWGCRFDAGHRYNGGPPVLFRSTDDGETWNYWDKKDEVGQSWDKNGGQGYYDMVVAMNPSNPRHVIFGLCSLYESKDGGATLVKPNIGGYFGRFSYFHSDMQDIQVLNGEEAWLSTDGGILHTNDFFKKDATVHINGIYASEMWGMGMGWNEDVMVGGRNHNGNMAQLDLYNGATIHLDGTETATGHVFLSNPRKVLFSDISNKFILPDNWETDTFEVPFTEFNVWTYPLESSTFGLNFQFDPRYAKSFYLVKNSMQGLPNDLWKTVDDGESFTSIYRFNEAISGIAVSRSNPDHLIVGTFGKIYHSEDAGQTFKEFENLPDRLQNAIYFRIEIHPKKDDEFWISNENEGVIYRTTDNGQTWVDMSEGLDFPNSNPRQKSHVYRFFLTGNDKNAVYAIGSVPRGYDAEDATNNSRIYYRDDITKTWVDYSEGLPNFIKINRMYPFFKEGEIRIGTSNGIWKRPLVDPDFEPIAQPLILSYGEATNKGEAEIQFDSYSIVNQTNATWEWSFSPEPLSVSATDVRNPKVRIAGDQSYDVTLTVSTPMGTDTKTIKNMIKGTKPVPEQEESEPTAIIGQEQLQRDVLLYPNVLKRGESISLMPHGLQEQLVLKVYDMQGHLLDKVQLSSQELSHISTTKYLPNTYLYFIKGANFKKIGKFVVR